MRVYSAVRLGVTQRNAISTIMIAVVTVGVLITSIATRTRATGIGP